jgi:hypothetical protein
VEYSDLYISKEYACFNSDTWMQDKWKWVAWRSCVKWRQNHWKKCLKYVANLFTMSHLLFSLQQHSQHKAAARMESWGS